MPGHYHVIGWTNYECTEGNEQVFGAFDSLNDALKTFVELCNEENALDFTFLDQILDEWMANSNDEELDLNDGCYGGSINLLYVILDEKGEVEDRLQVLTSYRGRDPYSKEISLGEYEKGDEFYQYLGLVSDDNKEIINSFVEEHSL